MSRSIFSVLAAVAITVFLMSPAYSNDDSDSLEEYHVYHILFKDESSAKAAYVQLQAVSPEKRLQDFKEIAKAQSIDRGSGKVGGHLGTIIEGMMLPSFDKAVLSTNVGELSEPFRSEFGWHLAIPTARRSLSVAKLCASSLAESIAHAEKHEKEMLIMSSQSLFPEDYFDAVKSHLGVAWGQTFVDAKGRLSFMQAFADGLPGVRRVVIHRELPKAILVPPSSSPMCYRSEQDTFLSDCRSGRIAYAGTKGFEGRAASGRVIDVISAKQEPYFTVVDPNTLVEQYYQKACGVSRTGS